MKQIAMIVLLVAACGGSPPVVEVPVSIVIVDESGNPIDMDAIDAEQEAAAACMAEWDAFVGEWNAYIEANDDGEWREDGEPSYGTFDEWATENGYPLTYEAHCPS